MGSQGGLIKPTSPTRLFLIRGYYAVTIQILNHRVLLRKTKLELSCFVSFKYFKTIEIWAHIAASGIGLKSPLKHAEARNKRIGVSEKG
jgi:hypothetical protein